MTDFYSANTERLIRRYYPKAYSECVKRLDFAFPASSWGKDHYSAILAFHCAPAMREAAHPPMDDNAAIRINQHLAEFVRQKPAPLYALDAGKILNYGSQNERSILDDIPAGWVPMAHLFMIAFERGQVVAPSGAEVSFLVASIKSGEEPRWLKNTDVETQMNIHCVDDTGTGWVAAIDYTNLIMPDVGFSISLSSDEKTWMESLSKIALLTALKEQPLESQNTHRISRGFSKAQTKRDRKAAKLAKVFGGES